MKLTAGRPTATAAKKAATLASLNDQKQTKRINFEVDEDQHRKLKTYASSQGKSIKEVMMEHVKTLILTIE